MVIAINSAREVSLWLLRSKPFTRMVSSNFPGDFRWRKDSWSRSPYTPPGNGVKSGYGLIPWQGSHDDLERLALSPEFGFEECP